MIIKIKLITLATMVSLSIISGQAFADRGIVSYYNTTKGYGFIAPDNGSSEIIVHKKDTEDGRLYVGSKVIYNVAQGRKGLRAVDVEIYG